MIWFSSMSVPRSSCFGWMGRLASAAQPGLDLFSLVCAHVIMCGQQLLRRNLFAVVVFWLVRGPMNVTRVCLIVGSEASVLVLVGGLRVRSE